MVDTEMTCQTLSHSQWRETLGGGLHGSSVVQARYIGREKIQHLFDAVQQMLQSSDLGLRDTRGPPTISAVCSVFVFFHSTTMVVIVDVPVGQWLTDLFRMY